MSEQIEALARLSQSQNALVPQDQEAAALSKIAGNTFLPRVQLVTNRCKQAADGFPINHFGAINGSTIVHLGANPQVIPFAWRPCFLDTGGENVRCFYRPTFDADGNITGPAEILDVINRSSVKDSGCMYGPQFLMWVPGIPGFATMLLGSISAKKETFKFRDQIGKPSVMRPLKVESKKYAPWYIATCGPCSVFDGALPTENATKNEIATFMNPPESEVELAAPAAEGARER